MNSALLPDGRFLSSLDPFGGQKTLNPSVITDQNKILDLVADKIPTFVLETPGRTVTFCTNNNV